MTVPRILLLAAGLGGVALAGTALAGATGSPLRQAILDRYAAEAGPGFAGFSAAAGGTFFHASPAAGNAGTPSCTTCHTQSPRNAGHTRAGKPIAPMAISRSPQRFTDFAKVEKWFRRNCHTVYGRTCTPVEKGNFIAFMAGQ